MWGNTGEVRSQSVGWQRAPDTPTFLPGLSPTSRLFLSVCCGRRVRGTLGTRLVNRQSAIARVSKVVTLQKHWMKKEDWNPGRDLNQGL